jgi:CheY-like chemotaxis protein
MNLVENAVKFTQQGEVFIGVQYSSPASGHPPELKFEVRDTGTGIQKEHLKQLFKGIPGKDLQKDGEKDAGLGLVICRKLVELMGGTIEASSKPGEGSSFTFNLPVTTSLKTQRDHARVSEMINLENKEVLIVDDNASNRNALMKLLKSWKMRPLIAESGKQALDMVTANEPDLVLVDIDMLGMDKLQLAGSISKQCPDLPIAGMSVPGDMKHKQQPDLFAALVTKPIRLSLFRDQLLDIFSQESKTDHTESKLISDLFAAKYPLRILVAEDNTINQKIAVKILGKLGYNPTLAMNGKEVMEIVGHDHYDVILMDVQMPEMDGLEATRMIRTCLEIQPVIIALTANAMQGDRDDCMQAGMDDYMSKPIEMKELLTQLEKWALAIRQRRKLSA